MVEKKSVQVRESHLRNSPSFLGKIVTTVHYGDRLSVVEDKSPWIKASINGKQGWLHDSALTTKTRSRGHSVPRSLVQGYLGPRDLESGR